MTEKQLSKCKVSAICGGCQLQDFSYPKQLAMKQEKVEKLLARFGKVNPIIGMKDPYHYRNKVQVAFCYERGRVYCGNYVASTHNVVDIRDCQLANKRANDIINSVRKLAISFKLPIFDEISLKGFLRHVLVRVADSTNQVMVVLVTGNVVFPKKRDFIQALLKKHPEITTIVQSINNRHTSMVLGDRIEVLYGKGYIEDELLGKTFRLSAASFYQVNPIQTRVLYSKAIEMANFNQEEIVMDAYCGTGTIGILFSEHVKKVLGVEINKQAIKDARINAKVNRVDNIDFIADDAGKLMEKLAYQKTKIDVVVMDPPRAGADEKFLSALVSLKPKKVVYISCNPVTQKDNLFYLGKHGYHVEQIQPVDMFPNTYHVETVVLLSKMNTTK